MGVTKKTKNKKIVKKAAVKTTGRVVSNKVRSHAYEEWTLSLVLGLVAVVLATLSVFGYHGKIALVAMLLGSVTVWLSMREQNYLHTLKGLVAIAISMATIYGYVIYTYDEIWMLYGYEGLL